MCGIIGFVDRKCEVAEETLIDMTDSMVHRGPDGKGYFFKNHTNTLKVNLGLGHRRLSILDLSTTANQPMSFDGLTIVFNGEVYNFNEIKIELIKHGYSFHTSSDTEVILKAFHKWGKACVNDFIGMFSFAIYDEKNDKLFVCRDRAGVKPLYFSHSNNYFLFASELKAFFLYPGFKKELSSEAVSLYFRYGYIPTPVSIFKNTYKLIPGNWLTYDILNNNLEQEEYWSSDSAYANKNKFYGSFDDAIIFGEQLIKNACEYRMISDVPVGVFLSGGYDSTLITSLLQSTRTDRLKTFTIGFHESEYNEAPHAKKIAQILGTDHTEYYCSTSDVLNLLPLISNSFDEPFADNSVFPTLLVSKLAREKVTVALSADAGDEVFGGYNKYDQFFDLRKIQKRIPPILFNSINKIIDSKFSDKLFSNAPFGSAIYDKVNRASFYLKSNSPEELLSSISTFYSKRELAKLINRESSNELNSPFIENSKLDSDFSRMLNIDYKTYLRDDILVKVDRCGMAVSLEGREPLLDHRILEWAATLPEEFKYHNDYGKKRLIKSIVHKYIPNEVMDRPKMGFGMPVKEWLAGGLKHIIEEVTDYDYIKEQSLFNYFEICRYKNRFKNGDATVYPKLWQIFMFQLWYDRWIKEKRKL